MAQLVVIVLLFMCLAGSACGTMTNASTLASSQCSDSCFVNCSEGCPDTCPPAMFCTQGQCRCASVYPNRLISCNGSSTMVLRYGCVTFDNKMNVTVVGSCPNRVRNFSSSPLYHHLPSNIDTLDEVMCSSLNRTGVMCGRCLPDHYPLAYSFDMNCIPCPHAHLNWLRYIMAAFLPLTFFYVIVLICQINITSSHLFVVVYFCQTVSLPVVQRSTFLQLSDSDDSFAANLIVLKVILSIYGIWNLDFFRPFYSDLCLGMGILPTMALDYVIALYPFFLIAITSLLLALYDRNCRLVMVLWRPVQICLSSFQRTCNWNRLSVPHTFATFFFLSNFKFLSLSFDFLIASRTHQLYQDHYNCTLRLYYAGELEYFGKEHLPYGILAIVTLTVFVLLPVVLLTVYPFGFFQKLLNKFPCRWYILHTLMDSFQGCYKDGTQPGTRDCRWLASVFFIARIFQLALFSQQFHVTFLALSMNIIVLYCILIAVTKPYKSSLAYYNLVNIIFLQLLALISASVLVYNFAVFMAPQFVSLFVPLALIFGACPLLYPLFVVLYWLFSNRRKV